MRKHIIVPLLLVAVLVFPAFSKPQQLRRKTPNIDRIGRNAFMTTPLCSPSRASFLTGQYPHTHGITDNVDRSFPRIKQMGYKAIRTERWKYIHYYELVRMDELYDLNSDPYEMTNVINQPHAAKALEQLKTEMQRLQTAQRTASPDTVIRELYRVHNNGRGHIFEAKGKKYIYKYFDQKLADLLWKTISETPEGEVGNLDFDPLYNAQDTQIRNFVIAKPVVKGDQSTVVVSFRNFNQRVTIKFEMVNSKDGWKISNVIYGGDSDLIKILNPG